METASRVPVENSFNQQSAAFNETTGPAIDPTTGPTIGSTTGSTTGPIAGTATDPTAGTATDPTTDAPGYLQQAREALISVAGTVQNAIGIDTPSSTLLGIAENTKIDASLPSSENTGATTSEHVGGVGSLPGNADEEGVARLPAERMSVPSREYEGTYPGEKVGGVGALPGNFNESGVALLPDERAAEGRANVEPSTRAAVHPRSENANIEPSTRAAVHPRSENANIEPSTRAAIHPRSENADIEPSTRAAIHPRSENANIEPSTRADTHSRSEKPHTSDMKTAAAHPIETAKQTRQDPLPSQGTEDDVDQPHKKVSLKDKIAGSVKVATGKVKKDEEMIAEGQARRGH